LLFLEGLLEERKQKLDGDLLQYIATDEVLAQFWDQCPADQRGLHKDYLDSLGVKIGDVKKS